MRDHGAWQAVHGSAASLSPCKIRNSGFIHSAACRRCSAPGSSASQSLGWRSSSGLALVCRASATEENLFLRSSRPLSSCSAGAGVQRGHGSGSSVPAAATGQTPRSWAEGRIRRRAAWAVHPSRAQGLVNQAFPAGQANTSFLQCLSPGSSPSYS